MVDTNDEWITSRVGIKERRILTEEGLGTSYMARKAAKELLQKTKEITFLKEHEALLEEQLSQKRQQNERLKQRKRELEEKLAKHKKDEKPQRTTRH